MKTALFFARISNLAALFIPWSWLSFVCAFTGVTSKHQRLISITLIYSLCILPFTFSAKYIPTVEPSILNFRYFTRLGPIYHLFTIEFFAITSFAFALLLKALSEFSGARKVQLQFLISATFIGFFGGSLTFFPAYNIPVPQYGLFFMPLYPFLMAYAMMRQGLLDSEEVLAIHRDKLALIGLLSSSINHEIKNPLFILQELSKKALSHLTGEPHLSSQESVKSITKMTEQIARMRTLVERLGEFGKANADAKSEVDIKQAIENALYFASQELRDHRVSVELKLADDLPLVQGNKSQFEEIFLNLFINAYHAMPNGGTLTIEGKSFTGAQDDHAFNKGVTVSVIDSGTGIPKDDLKNIFKPFYTTKKDKGTGLGLHIVKTLAEQNGGKISVNSEIGKGTRFILKFSI